MSSEWQVLSLQDAGITLIDCDHRTPQAVPNGYPYIAIPQLKDGHVSLDGVRRISGEDFLDWTKKLLPQENDVIVVRRCNSGQSAYIPAGLKCAIGQNLVVLRSNGEKVLPEYLRWLVRGEEWWSQVSKYINVGAVFDSLRCRDIPKFELPIPPLKEQKEISELLFAIDERITLLRETNTTLEAIAQALFKSWFVDFDPVHAKQQGRAPEGMDAQTAALFPDSFEDSELGMVPKGWRASNLGEIASFQNGYAFKSKDWQDSGHPVVKIGDVKPGIIDLSGCSFVSPSTLKGLERFGLFRGDLLVGMTGYVGETGLVPSHNPQAFLNQRVGRIAAKNKQACFEYIYCAIRNSAFKEFAISQSHGSAQANVSGAAILEYPIVLPCEKIIDAFSGIVKVLIEKILTNHEQALALASCRDTLLPRLIAGQLRLPEAQALVEDAVDA